MTLKPSQRTAASKPMRMLLAHPGTASFVKEVALALHEGQMLERFATTVVDRPAAAWRDALERLPFVGTRVDRELRRRRVPAWLETRTKSHPGPEILRVLATRVDRSGRLAHQVWERSEPAFDRWVARTQLADVDGVYGFAQASLETFRRARERGLFIALDLPSPSQEHFAEVVERELERWPELSTPYLRNLTAQRAAVAACVREQIALADCVIANSRFTLSTYTSRGYPMSHARAVPLGAAAVSTEIEPTSVRGGPLRVLCASALAVHKGGHVLLEAFHREALARSRSADAMELTVCGGVTLPSSFVAARSLGVRLRGHLPQQELHQLYRESDVLVLPTLADGFGLVVAEALAHGLPVITTDQCGAAELIAGGTNGLITCAGDVDSLRHALAFCADNRGALESMRSHALTSAREHSWARYRSELRATLQAAMHVRESL